MHFARAVVAALGLFSCGVGAFRKPSRSPQEPQELWDAEDTFDLADDHSQQQQNLATPVGAAGAEEDATETGEPMAAGNTPACASRGRGQRVVSVADLHGDFDAMAKHLHLLGLLSRRPSQRTSTWRNIWAGGDTIFVQTGDILDRGPDGKAMYKFLWALQDQAPAGQVVLMTGNHELMVLQGDLRYVTNIDFCSYTSDNCGGRPPSSAAYCDTCWGYRNGSCSRCGSACLRGNCEFLEAWDRNGEMGGEMRRRFLDGRMKLSYQVNGVVFIHAGLASSIWSKIGSNSIDRLNNISASLIGGSSGLSLRNSNSIIAAGTGQNGPMWTRMCYDNWMTRSSRRRSGSTYYMDDNEVRRVERSRCATIAKSLRDMSATRMVIGHCPQSGGNVRVSCGGTFVEADTYMSIAYAGSRRAADNNMAALEFFSGDPEQKVWAVYSGRNRCQRL